jgi:hypothetical protein
MQLDSGTRTLVVVCKGGFCELLERMLDATGLSSFRRGQLSFADSASISRGNPIDRNVFVVVTDEDQAARLMTSLRACPIKGTSGPAFEVYIVP